MRTKQIWYRNLTQEIPNITPINRLCYFRSTDVEQKNYERLLWSVPDEILFQLAKGYLIIITDSSTKTKGKIERIFIPVLKDILNYLWFGMGRTGSSPEHHNFALEALEKNNSLKQKFLYWKNYAEHPVKLTAKTNRIERELDVKELRKIMHDDD